VIESEPVLFVVLASLEADAVAEFATVPQVAEVVGEER
jgi:hypothetical protein